MINQWWVNDFWIDEMIKLTIGKKSMNDLYVYI